MKILKRHLNHALEIVFHFLKADKKQIMFLSFRGQYNDNPKYISERLHKLYPKLKIIWAISNRCHEINLIPDYVELVEIDSVRYAYLKSKSGVLVDNGAGWYLWANVGLFAKMVKKSNQFNLSTWHGTPLKSIGKNVPGNEKIKYSTTSNCLICGNRYCEDIFTRAYEGLMNTKLVGTPRNDLLINYSEEDVFRLRTKLKLPINKKLLLFAPTYRDNPSDSGIIQLGLIDIEQLKNTLKRKFNGDWEIVFRAHNMVLEEIEKLKILNDFDIIDGNQFDDMIEYSVACDALLTDYSGAIFDNTLTDKPCFLFAHDYEHYKNVERGFYMSIDEFPYSFCATFEELLKSIEDYDTNLVHEKCKSFLAKIGSVEDGKATDRVIELLKQHININ